MGIGQAINLVNSVPELLSGLLSVNNSIIPVATSIRITELAPYADEMPVMGAYSETI